MQVCNVNCVVSARLHLLPRQLLEVQLYLLTLLYSIQLLPTAQSSQVLRQLIGALPVVPAGFSYDCPPIAPGDMINSWSVTEGIFLWHMELKCPLHRAAWGQL